MVVLTKFLLAVLPLSAVGAGFVSIELPGSQLTALSHDGTAGAGGLLGAATGGFRWSDAHGIELLEHAMSVQGISASGRYVAGSSLDPDQREVASYWAADGHLVRLGGLADAAWQGGLVSIAFGISDEPRVVGMVNDADRHAKAFEWVAATGMQPLPSLVKAKNASASGLSSDGRHVYGWIEPQPGRRLGMLWNDDVPQRLSAPDGNDAGEVFGANRDATVLLGNNTSPGGDDIAYRWAAATGLQALPAPTLTVHASLRFFASSDDGRVLVGSSGNGAARVAIVWTSETGLQPLDAVLAAHGMQPPAGWTLAAATGVSGEGRRIAGWGQHGGHLDSFIVDLPAAARSVSAVPPAAPRIRSQGLPATSQ